MRQREVEWVISEGTHHDTKPRPVDDLSLPLPSRKIETISALLRRMPPPPLADFIAESRRPDGRVRPGQARPIPRRSRRGKKSIWEAAESLNTCGRSRTGRLPGRPPGCSGTRRLPDGFSLPRSSASLGALATDELDLLSGVISIGNRPRGVARRVVAEIRLRIFRTVRRRQNRPTGRGFVVMVGPSDIHILLCEIGSHSRHVILKQLAAASGIAGISKWFSGVECSKSGLRCGARGRCMRLWGRTAGKSTLMNIVSGMWPRLRDNAVGGQPVRPRSPREARAGHQLRGTRTALRAPIERRETSSWAVTGWPRRVRWAKI